ncbi:UDP-N-acetyl-D-glucosamine 6-dehydrogenase [compost metagenome]
MTPLCSATAAALYKTFVKGECVITNARTAEMCKLTENSFRDVNIAFANELSLICDKQDINVWELIRLANLHPRVNILQPGPGVGGHCIAVDPWFIVSACPDEARLIKTAREVNDHKPNWVVEKVKILIEQYLSENSSKNLKDVCVACFGLSFKANIDDLRESPALEIAKSIGGLEISQLLIVEPHIQELPSSLAKAKLVSPENALDAAHILVLLVDHRGFEKYSQPASKKLVIDTRGMWSRSM